MPDINQNKFNYDEISLKVLTELEKIKNGLTEENMKDVLNHNQNLQNLISLVELGKDTCQEDDKKKKDETTSFESFEINIPDSIGEEFMKTASKLRIEVIEEYLFHVAPLYTQIAGLRQCELSKIFLLPEFIEFKNSLSEDEKISIDGYLIHRKRIHQFGEYIPGFIGEDNCSFEYGQTPEDITYLFGSKEYLDKIKEIRSKIISFKEFIKEYYDTPYMYHLPSNVTVMPLTKENIVKAYNIGDTKEN